MAIEKELLDQLLAGRDPRDVFNKDGLVDELKKSLSERILNAELDEHLDGEDLEVSTAEQNPAIGRRNSRPLWRPRAFQITGARQVALAHQGQSSDGRIIPRRSFCGNGSG